jgi:hypothetical protein
MRLRVMACAAAALTVCLMSARARVAFAAQPCQKAGIYVESERGFLPLTFFVEHAPQMPVRIAGGAQEDIPSVSTLKAFVVNMMGWKPSRLTPRTYPVRVVPSAAP